MRQAFAFLFALAVLSTSAVEPNLTAKTRGSEPTGDSRSGATRPELRFERNAGQFPEGSLFGVRSGPQAVSFARDGIAFAQPDGSVGVRMRWLGGSTNPDLRAEEQFAGVANYLYGPDPSTWQTKVELFKRIRYHDVYPGIDLVFYDRDGQLEYDFVVEPEAEPAVIALAFDGADSVRILDSGDLAVVKADAVHSHHKAPVVYQDVEGERRIVDSRFVLSDDGVVHFDIADRDPNETLVIDPGIVYSTLLGGGLRDQANGVATDAAGSVYVTGWTSSFSFPVRNPLFGYNPGSRPDGTFSGDCFVSKFTPDGSALVYSTYIGGSLFDEGTAIAVGPDGAVYVAGTTWSADFPTLHPIRTNDDLTDNPYDKSTEDPFVFKISADGTDLVYSTYLGGRRLDEAYAIEVDGTGAAIVAGTTESTDFLTTLNAFQTTDPNLNSPLGNQSDGFISKIAPTGSRLEFSTYVGGSARNSALLGLTRSSNGDLLVCGWTYERFLFPAVPQSFLGPLGQGDVLAARFSGDVGSARWVCLLGGDALDAGTDIAVDIEGSVYVAGWTTSSDFPTLSPLQSNTDSGYTSDAVLFKLSDDGTEVRYSTYLGGSDGDTAEALVVNPDGSVIVAGETESLDFPTVLAHFPYANHSSFYSDGFIAKVSPSGSVLEQCTYYGGQEWDAFSDLALVPGGDVAASGSATGPGFPVWNAFLADTFDGSAADGFVARFRFSLGAPPVITKAKGRRSLPGRPERGKIFGTGFKPGAVVFAGNDLFGVRLFETEVKANGTTIVVTDQRFDLYTLLSGEGDHTIRVTNPDGGQAILRYRK